MVRFGGPDVGALGCPTSTGGFRIGGGGDSTLGLKTMVGPWSAVSSVVPAGVGPVRRVKWACPSKFGGRRCVRVFLVLQREEINNLFQKLLRTEEQ